MLILFDFCSFTTLNELLAVFLYVIRDSGLLGVRRVSFLAPSTFVASAVSTLSLQETIL